MPPRPAAPVSPHQQPVEAAAAAADPNPADPLDWDAEELEEQEWKVEGLPGILMKRSLEVAVGNVGEAADHELLQQWRQRDWRRETAEHPFTKVLSVSRTKAEGPLGMALVQLRMLKTGRPWLYVGALGVRHLGGLMSKEGAKRIVTMEHAVCQALLDGLDRVAQGLGCGSRIATDYSEEAGNTASPRVSWMLGFVTDLTVLPEAQQVQLRQAWGTSLPAAKLPVAGRAPPARPPSAAAPAPSRATRTADGEIWAFRHDRLLPPFTTKPGGEGQTADRWVERWRLDAACLRYKSREAGPVAEEARPDHAGTKWTKAGIQAGLPPDGRKLARKHFEGIAVSQARLYLSQAAYVWCVPDDRPAATRAPAAAAGQEGLGDKRHRKRNVLGQAGLPAAAAAPAAGQAPAPSGAPPAPAPGTPAQRERQPQAVPATGAVAPANVHPALTAASPAPRSPRMQMSELGATRLFDGDSQPLLDGHSQLVFDGDSQPADDGTDGSDGSAAADVHSRGGDDSGGSALNFVLPPGVEPGQRGRSREELAAAMGLQFPPDFLAGDARFSGDKAPKWRPLLYAPLPAGCPHPDSAEFGREWLMGAFDTANSRGYTAEYWAEPEEHNEQEEEEEDDDDETPAGFGEPAEPLCTPRSREQLVAELLDLPRNTLNWVDRDDHVAVPWSQTRPWSQTPASAL